MDEAEDKRLRELIKSKQIKPDKITPERQAEIDKTLDEIAKRLVITEVQPNRFFVTALPEVEAVAPGKEPPAFSVEAGCLFRGRLTKGIVQTLPEGAIVQSNTFHDKWTPVAVETVGAPDTREDLWKRLRSLRVTNVTCNVWQNAEAYRRSMEEWERRYPR